jgi:hypothetical protein
VCDILYDFCANFILLFFTFLFLFAHKIYDHIVSHFLLFVIIHPLFICWPVLTIGLGAAVAEIIYALSSVHLGQRGTSFNRDPDNQDCTSMNLLELVLARTCHVMQYSSIASK